MNKFLLLILLPLFFTACKNKEARVYDLVTTYNEHKEAISNPNLKHTKAYSLDKRTVSLDFIFDTKEDTFGEPYGHELAGILQQVDQKYPECKKLMKDGMTFTLRVYNAFGIKITEFPLEIDSEGKLQAKK